MGARNYTPRHFHFEDQELAIEFALRDGGPVALSTASAKPGDSPEVAGPVVSSFAPGKLRRSSSIGDETALSAIGRSIEEATPEIEISVSSRRRAPKQNYVKYNTSHAGILINRRIEKCKPHTCIDGCGFDQ